MARIRDTYFRDPQDGFFYWRNGSGHIEQIYAFDLLENPKRSKPPVYIDKLVPQVTLDGKSILFLLLTPNLPYTTQRLGENGNFLPPMPIEGYFARHSTDPLPQAVKKRKRPPR